MSGFWRNYFVKKIPMIVLFLITIVLNAQSLLSDKAVITFDDGQITQREISLTLAYRMYQHSNHFMREKIIQSPKKKDLLELIALDSVIAKEFAITAGQSEVIDRLTYMYSAEIAGFLLRNKIYVETKASVNEDEIKKYYQDHIKEFKVKKTYSYRVIFDKIPEDEKLAKKLQVRFDQIQKRLVKKEIQLSDACQEFYPNKKMGKMRTIESSRIPKPYLTVLSKMKPGEFSQPIQAEQTICVIEMVSKQLNDTLSLKRVRKQIQHKLETHKRNIKIRTTFRHELDQFPVSIYIPENFDLEKDKAKPLIESKKLNLKLNYEYFLNRDDAIVLEEIFSSKALLEKYLKKYADNLSAYLALVNIKDKNILKIEKLSRNIFTSNIYFSQLYEKIPTEASEKQLLSFYRKNQDQYDQKEKYYIKQITVDAQEDEKKKDLEKRVRKIYDALIAGEDFDLLCRTHSMDKYSNQGGIVGWVRTAGLNENSAAIGSLKKKKYSKPFAVKDGYRIIQYSDYTPFQQNNFNDVRNQVNSDFRKTEIRKVFSDARALLFEKYNVEFIDTTEVPSNKK